MRPLYFKHKGEVELVKLAAAPELKGSGRQPVFPSLPMAWDWPGRSVRLYCCCSGALACGRGVLLAAGFQSMHSTEQS